MGWTGDFINEKRGYGEIKDFIMNLWTTSNSDKTVFWKAEKTAIRGLTAFTIVNHYDMKTGKNDRFIAVTLFSQRKHGNGYEFIYKDMTEHAGPTVKNCPASYIKELGGVEGIEDEGARAWRNAAMEYAAKAKIIQNHRTDGKSLRINFGGEENVTYNKRYNKWVVDGKNTYIPAKYVTPYNLVDF